MFSVSVPLDASEWECRTMLMINEAAQKFLSGQLDTGTYLDMVETAGIDPDTWLNERCEFLGLSV
jgi:uncharacterized protein YjbK